MLVLSRELKPGFLPRYHILLGHHLVSLSLERYDYHWYRDSLNVYSTVEMGADVAEGKNKKSVVREGSCECKPFASFPGCSFLRYRHHSYAPFFCQGCSIVTRTISCAPI